MPDLGNQSGKHYNTIQYSIAVLTIKLYLNSFSLPVNLREDVLVATPCHTIGALMEILDGDCNKYYSRVTSKN